MAAEVQSGCHRGLVGHFQLYLSPALSVMRTESFRLRGSKKDPMRVL